MKYIFKIILITLLIFYGTRTFSATIPAPMVVSFSIIPESSPTMLEIKWIPSQDTSVIGYFIFKYSNGSWGKIDTIYGRLSYFAQILTDSGIYNGAAEYAIGCYVSGAVQALRGDGHTTIYLDTISFEKCDTTATLKWTPYLGWDDNVEKYNIYRRAADSTYYELIDTVPNYMLTYSDNILNMSNTYYYYIEAVNPRGYTATSNAQSIYTETFAPPAYIIADYATVDSAVVKLLFTVDPSAPELKQYYIKRKDYRSNGEYLKIAEIENTGQMQVSYTDSYARTDDYSYSYVIASVSSCGVETAISNPATTIHLTASNLNETSAYLKWNEYEYWAKGVYKYKIYLVDNDETKYPKDADFFVHDFTYDLKDLIVECHKNTIPLSNKICYLVEAIENIDTTMANYVSRSNVACMYKEPIIHVPSAFNPVSDIPENRTFRPVVSFVDLESYELKIFDRLGERIFETTDVFTGWDGKFKNGKFVEQQVYTYQIKYKGDDGKIKRLTGRFAVIFK
jgi:gliding motility-associated-like protein